MSARFQPEWASSREKETQHEQKEADHAVHRKHRGLHDTKAFQMKKEEFFILIGQFAVEFEKVCCEMEDCAMDLLEREGLKNLSVRKILLANMTAEPLRSLLQALLAEFFDPAKFQMVLAKVFQEMQSLTTARNQIIHAKWNTPIDDPDWEIEKPHVSGQKIKSSKKGESSAYLKYTRVDFEKLIDACVRLQRIFTSLRFLMEFPNQLDAHLRVSRDTLELFPASEK